MTNGYEVRYICNGCGEHRLMVRYRNKDEDIINYMDNVIKPGLGRAHRAQSPRCNALSADLRLHIPVNADGVGMRPVQ